METDIYLIWSHEHGLWWGPNRSGYTARVSQAGRYSRLAALAICAGALPGTSTDLGAMPELPVRLADIAEMIADYDGRYSARAELWR